MSQKYYVRRAVDPPKLDNGMIINLIEISMNIKTIDNIDLEGIMTLTSTITVEWRDPRLEFLNIRDGAEGLENVKAISYSLWDQLWLPLDNIVHENAVIGQIDEGLTYLHVIAKSGPLFGDQASHKEGQFLQRKDV